MGEAVVRLAPGELSPEALSGRRCVYPDQLDPGDHSQVLERLDVDGSAESRVMGLRILSFFRE